MRVIYRANVVAHQSKRVRRRYDGVNMVELIGAESVVVDIRRFCSWAGQLPERQCEIKVPSKAMASFPHK